MGHSDAAQHALAELVSSEMQRQEATEQGTVKDVFEELSSGLANANDENNLAPAPLSAKVQCEPALIDTSGPISLADKNGVCVQSMTQGATCADLEPKASDDSRNLDSL